MISTVVNLAGGSNVTRAALSTACTLPEHQELEIHLHGVLNSLDDYMPIYYIDERCVDPRLNVKAVGLVLGDLDNLPHPPEMSLILCLPAHHQKPIW